MAPGWAGGLTAAALLVKAGHRITVLEAQAYPGGCAGTFHHQGYLFDAGATLAGGFAPGGPHARVADLLVLQWPVRRVDRLGWCTWTGRSSSMGDFVFPGQSTAGSRWVP